MDSRRDMDGLAAGLMVLLSMAWGMQQVVIKAAATDIAPVLQLSLRSGIAALLVAAVIYCRRQRLPFSGSWKPGLLAGFLFSMEFLLVGEGLRHTTASHMVVFLYSAPIFVALTLHWKLPSERLNLLQWTGILLAFAGIALTFLGRDPDDGGTAGNMLWGDLLGLLAGACWGATTVLIRCSSLARIPATWTLLYQLLVCFVLLLPAALLLGHSNFSLTPVAWGSLLFQGVVVSFASFLTWFWLLRRYPASQLGVFSFVTPLFGILFGVLLLDETLDQGFVTGAVLVMAGIVLVNGHKRISRGVRLLKTG